MTDSKDLFSVLGLSRSADESEIKRRYRTLASRHHPDKGGDPGAWADILQAYKVLSDPSRRKLYLSTGRVESDPLDALHEALGGAFVPGRAAEPVPQRPTDAVIPALQESGVPSSGFEAWLRARNGGAAVITSDEIASRFGVVNYDKVILPPTLAAQAICTKAGEVAIESKPLPQALEWGEVLVGVRFAPISPADVYTVKTGGVYGYESATPPFIPGHDMVASVLTVGPGVKELREGDLVIPSKTFVGTWRELIVLKEKDVIKLSKDSPMPLEAYCALRELVTAYCVVQQSGLKPGDGVIVNGASGLVGQVLIQLCSLLKLRCYALIPGDDSDPVRAAETVALIKKLGATEVLEDTGLSLKLQLMEKYKVPSLPSVAVDVVGGQASARLAEALCDGATLWVLGSMGGGKPVSINWQSFVFRGITVRGFNARTWIEKNRSSGGKSSDPLSAALSGAGSDKQSAGPGIFDKVVDALGAMVKGGKIALPFVEYSMATELTEAFAHAGERHKGTRIIVRGGEGTVVIPVPSESTEGESEAVDG